MQTTLAERLHEAMNGKPKRTGAELARACNVKQPSVSDWLSGKSRSMDGSNLIDAAEFLGVNAKWLIKGVGLMRPGSETGATPSAHLVTNTEVPEIYHSVPADPWLSEGTDILRRLEPADRRAAVLQLRVFVAQLGPAKPPKD